MRCFKVRAQALVEDLGKDQVIDFQDENDSLKDRVRNLEAATEHFTASLGTAPAHTQLAMKARESIYHPPR